MGSNGFLREMGRSGTTDSFTEDAGGILCAVLNALGDLIVSGTGAEGLAKRSEELEAATRDGSIDDADSPPSLLPFRRSGNLAVCELSPRMCFCPFVSERGEGVGAFLNDTSARFSQGGITFPRA